VSFTRITTGSSFLFGGRSTFGDATTDVITGGTSTTVTEVTQLDLFPDASVAVQVAGVVPNPNVEPDGGTQLDVTAGQLSNTVGVRFAAAPLELVHIIDCGAGQVMVGFCMSLTVTVALQDALSPTVFDQ